MANVSEIVRWVQWRDLPWRWMAAFSWLAKESNILFQESHLLAPRFWFRQAPRSYSYIACSCQITAYKVLWAKYGCYIYMTRYICYLLPLQLILFYTISHWSPYWNYWIIFSTKWQLHTRRISGMWKIAWTMQGQLSHKMIATTLISVAVTMMMISRCCQTCAPAKHKTVKTLHE
jgi:hypothetical protein